MLKFINESLNGFRKFNRKQWLTIFVFAIADFCSAICVSLQAPFYPKEAENKGGKIEKKKIKYVFFASWNYFSKFYGKVGVTFPSHLKKLRSILRFWLEKLNCGFFYSSFHSWKNTITKQLFPSKFQCRK